VNQFPTNPESRKLLRQIVITATVCTLLLFIFLLSQPITNVQTLPPIAGPAPRMPQEWAITPAERAFVDKFMKEMKAKQKSYEKQVELCSPKLKDLLTAKSFANKATMDQAKMSLEACADIDFKLYNEITRMVDSLPTRLEKESMTPRERQEVVASFHSGTESMIKQLDEQHAQELAWFEATRDVYTFALQHATKIHILGGKITTLDDEVRNGLNQRIERATKLSREFDVAHGQTGTSTDKGVAK
jgi:hypothetical protein